MTATSTTPAVLELRGVGFDYGTNRVIDELELVVEPGELVVCVGPSGCGKSTLLGLLGGHLAPTRGTIERRGQTRTIYQDGGLFPWLTVRGNIARGVAARKVTAAERDKKVDDWLAITRLQDFADHYPHQLSGGMRQRVELCACARGRDRRAADGRALQRARLSDAQSHAQGAGRDARRAAAHRRCS